MADRLWRWYRFAFIRTPLAAVCIIVILAAGMYILMDSIKIRQYDTIKGTLEPSPISSVIYMTARMDTKRASLHPDEEVIWYIRSNGSRYTAKADTVQSNEQGTLVRIRVEAAEWNRAKTEAIEVPSQYLVDIPTGEQTVPL